MKNVNLKCFSPEIRVSPAGVGTHLPNGLDQTASAKIKSFRTGKFFCSVRVEPSDP